MTSVRPTEINVRTTAREIAFESLSAESKEKFQALEERVDSGELDLSQESKIADLYLFAYHQDLLDELSSCLDQRPHSEEELDQIKKTLDAAKQVKNDMSLRYLEEFESVKFEIEYAHFNYDELKESTKKRFKELKAQNLQFRETQALPQINADLFLAELNKLKQKKSELEKKIQEANEDANNIIAEIARIGKSSSERIEQIKKSNARYSEDCQKQYQELLKFIDEIKHFAKKDEAKEEPQNSLEKMFRQIESDMYDYQRYQRRISFFGEDLNHNEAKKNEADDEWYEKQINGGIQKSITEKQNSFKGINHKSAVLGPSMALKNGATIFLLVTAFCLGIAAGLSNPIGWGIFAAYLLTGSYFLVRNYVRSRERTGLLQAHKNPGLEGLLHEENELEKKKDDSILGSLFDCFRTNTTSRDMRVLFMKDAIVRCKSLTPKQYDNLKIHGENHIPFNELEQDEVPCVVNLKLKEDDKEEGDKDLSKGDKDVSKGGKDFSKCPLFYSEKRDTLFFKKKRHDGGYENVALAADPKRRVEQYKEFSKPSSPASAA